MNLYKLFLLGVAVFYNTACDGYYESDKNPFKVSGKCDNDIYRYSKQDLPNEEFGKIGVVANTQEYPRAGIDKAFSYNNDKILSMQGKFASLCKSSIINKVKIELHNNYGKVKTYYPNISSGYYGDISLEINMSKDQENRCFFNDTGMTYKTWARDEDGNTYYAHKHSPSEGFNVGSDIAWDIKYKYEYRDNIEYEYVDINSSIKYETEDKIYYTELNGKIYGLLHQYTYKYRYEYKYAHKYRYKYPVEISIYGDNDYPGEYFEMFIIIPDADIEKMYPISNEERKVDFLVDGNSKLKADVMYNAQVSFVEKLNNCNITSRLITKSFHIPSKSIENIESILISTTKVLLDTTKLPCFGGTCGKLYI